MVGFAPFKLLSYPALKYQRVTVEAGTACVMDPCFMASANIVRFWMLPW
jgi:hypothetical protein